jgi:large subunit ribosomal protein L3
MKFIIAKKIEMSQEFAEDGNVIPVTVLEAGPVVVTQVKTNDTDGYQAVQVGFGTRKAKHVSKPVQGHLKDLGLFSVLKEFRARGGDDATYERGQKLTVESFVSGDMVDVTGVSIGHGNAGVVKRHGFKGKRATHGTKDQMRKSGSLASKRQGPVAPGKRMAGHMGASQITVKNIQVVSVDAANNRMSIRGAVPGAPGAVVFIQTAKNARVKKAAPKGKSK